MAVGEHFHSALWHSKLLCAVGFYSFITNTSVLSCFGATNFFFLHPATTRETSVLWYYETGKNITNEQQ